MRGPRGPQARGEAEWAQHPRTVHSLGVCPEPGGSRPCPGDQLCRDPTQPHLVITRQGGLLQELRPTCPSGPHNLLPRPQRWGAGYLGQGLPGPHPWKNQLLGGWGLCSSSCLWRRLRRDGQPRAAPLGALRDKPARPGVLWGDSTPPLPWMEPHVPGYPGVGPGAPPPKLHTYSGPKLKCHRPVGEAQISRPQNMSLLDKTILVLINVDFLWQRQRRP